MDNKSYDSTMEILLEKKLQDALRTKSNIDDIKEKAQALNEVLANRDGIPEHVQLTLNSEKTEVIDYSVVDGTGPISYKYSSINLGMDR